ncbi:MAG: phosphatidylserine decarboxylase family protein [Flavobacteriales bacterium]|nr:phosphatidylserine decarboxylase family protein [Flavobacteriales bacterium]
MTLHREGHRLLGVLAGFFIGFNALFIFISSSFQWYHIVALVISLILFLLVAQFFRVPKRITVGEDNELICPADGKVVVIEETQEDEYFKDKRIQISIFMSPLNVHVQWSPIKGIVKMAKYHAGLFLVAWDPKSSTDNERTTLVVEHPSGTVARRIKYYIQEGQSLEKGEEVGFIKFGSRVDIFLPLGTEVCVELDQKVSGRTTVLARLK